MIFKCWSASSGTAWLSTIDTALLADPEDPETAAKAYAEQFYDDTGGDCGMNFVVVVEDEKGGITRVSLEGEMDLQWYTTKVKEIVPQEISLTSEQWELVKKLYQAASSIVGHLRSDMDYEDDSDVEGLGDIINEARQAIPGITSK